MSATLQELCSAAGVAVSGGGTLIPMREVIQMAGHAYHYLAVFDEHTERPLYLGRTKRIASPDQRIVLYAKDRGCSAPGCDKPGYWTEVHHVNEWVAKGGQTNVDEMTLACGGDHKLVTPGGCADHPQTPRRQNGMDPTARTDRFEAASTTTITPNATYSKSATRQTTTMRATRQTTAMRRRSPIPAAG